MPSVVYVLTHSAMPGLVKIGVTAQEDVQTRLNQLYTTGLPFPFDLAYACQIEDDAFAEEAETALHSAFDPYRVNPRREFFQIDPGQAIVLLKLLETQRGGMESTEVSELTTGGDEVDAAAARQYEARRPNLTFEAMGIPIGARIKLVNSDSEVEVVGPKTVNLNGETMFLTKATQLLVGSRYPLRPAPYWTYEGRRLSEIYEETYPLQS